MSWLDRIFYTRREDSNLGGGVGEAPESLKLGSGSVSMSEAESEGIERLNIVRNLMESYSPSNVRHREMVLSNRIVVTALDKISSGIDRVDLRVEDELGAEVTSGMTYILANDELYGESYDMRELIKLVRLDLLLYGNSLIVPVKSTLNGDVISFHKLDMSRVRFEGDLYTGIEFTYTSKPGEYKDDVEYVLEDTIHITTSVKDTKGLGVPEASKFWVDLVMYESLTKLEYGIVESGGITPVQFSTDVQGQKGKHLKEYLDSIKTYITGMLQREDTYNSKVLVTSSDVKFNRFVGDIRELEINEKLGKYANNIITSMQLHPSDVGDTDNSTYNNEKVRMIEFWEIAVLPYVIKVVDKINMDLDDVLVVEVPELEEARLSVDTDKKEESEILYNTSRSIKMLIDSGVIDEIEAREILERGVGFGE